ncbi:hypothetical protein EJ066_27575 [Mesorhizobium sp. M9A.F.Ca.ET.002.03.1.2]|uniref:hypothetical protein n=1 Tax=Mesorhizobium sp. M9A.F.Ca.ET.002.03.1.2 TaxID=2493668 RepID=UPI000F761862|nr:hypothetical protein [Mesorhizobium sp. M9A.F.Ca.ET.002.03.1.2]AZO00578.1 hypothetical protein EJ066_27575 [Mesorhizobium sp. M9A.F.Ca.ET.002.03.1.2]
MTTIPLAEDLGRARTAADFAAVIALLDVDLNNVAARKQELEQAEDRAIFGDGDLGEVRAALARTNAAIALIEKTIEAAHKRRAAAAQSEARADIVALGEEIAAKAEALTQRWQTANWLIEQLRLELFEADALSRAIATANGRLDAAGAAELKINLTTIRRAAMAGPRAAVPARLSRRAIQADKLLLSFLSPGGALDPRPALGAPVEGVKSKFIPVASERG